MNQLPNTCTTLKRDFAALGVKAGDVIIMHSSMKALGWTVGGPVAVIDALLDLLTPEGTLIVPTQSTDNSDPAYWQNPPVPEAWWEIIRAETPAYRPEVTPTREMGLIVETFRHYPDVIRSDHPMWSFAGWGQHAATILAGHTVGIDFAEESPLQRIYDLNGYVLLLGVDHGNNTSLHLAEHRSNFRGKSMVIGSTAMFVNGKRKWVTWEHLDYNEGDFSQLGAAFESRIGYQPGKVGQADARLLSQRAIVDFAVQWLEQNR